MSVYLDGYEIGNFNMSVYLDGYEIGNFKSLLFWNNDFSELSVRDRTAAPNDTEWLMSAGFVMVSTEETARLRAERISVVEQHIRDRGPTVISQVIYWAKKDAAKAIRALMAVTEGETQEVP